MRKERKRKMSKYTRPVYSRPRTKVYDTNYNIGESYYKSALDGLDRKYGKTNPGDFFNSSMTSQPPFGERSGMGGGVGGESSATRSAMKEMDDFFDDRKKKKMGSLMDEPAFDDVFTSRMKNGNPSRNLARALEDEFDQDVASSMRKLKSVKISKSMAENFDDEDIASSIRDRKDSRLKSKLDFSDKLMDSVGLTGKARAALEDDDGFTSKKRFIKMTSSTEFGGDTEDLTKWTALKPRKFLESDSSSDLLSSGAAARALKSRARLEDLESEMQALSEKSAAREKRVRDLKALVQENEANAIDNLQSTVKISSSIQSEKRKVNF
ncbi:hypothetical protein Phum_PHUM538590 [Pediculus humanus corporis]|uniref:Uncharacterized protein n=1 Tax=Pediculus humanus subsp. corporis TaxID=121224 RepID=E0VZV1_PEDHC|nr:uncharacterized protein Phum_PHUM538590 [Pediculus humanus corporis]EEB18907.1 hypothetical protein Phum_PHUM538590 [Pediculus humanus corporis]